MNRSRFQIGSTINTNQVINEGLYLIHLARSINSLIGGKLDQNKQNGGLKFCDIVSLIVVFFFFFFCPFAHYTTPQYNNYNTYTTNETLPTLMTIQYLDNLQYYILLTVWYSNHSKIM